MSAHTPGPWKADITRKPQEFAVIVDLSHHGPARGIAEIATGIYDKWTPEDEANARLIAAAPELLAEVRRSLGAWEKIQLTRAPIHPLCNAGERSRQEAADVALQDIIASHRAAIAKAEGKS